MLRTFCWVILFAGLIHAASQTECISRGRFPNNDEPDCRGYTMCLIGGATNYTQYKLTCPIGFVYSHLELQCTNATAYTCLPNHKCTEVGSFENILDENCTSFVMCAKGLGEIVTARRIACPESPETTVFDPSIASCVKATEYACHAAETTIATTSTTTEVVHNTSNGFQLSNNIPVNGVSCVCDNFLIVLFIICLIKCF